MSCVKVRWSINLHSDFQMSVDHGRRGRSPSREKKTVRGHDAWPYEVPTATRFPAVRSGAGTSAVKRRADC